MKCNICDKENAAGQNFCGSCGAQIIEIPKLSDYDLRKHIELVIQEKYKEQQLLEFQTTENVIAKINTWAKLFGFFVGIPIAVFLFILGSMGYNSFSEFTKTIKETRLAMHKNIEGAATQIHSLNKKTAQLTIDAEKLKNELVKIRLIPAEAQKLSNQIGMIEKQINMQAKGMESTMKSLNQKIKLEQQISTLKLAIDDNNLALGVNHIKGKVYGTIPRGYYLYAVLQIGTEYNVMFNQVNITKNGDWEHDFLIGIRGANLAIGLLLCDENAKNRIENQLQNHNHILESLTLGMRVIGTVKINI